MKGLKTIFTLTRENNPEYKSGHIDITFIEKNITNFKKQFYICGPDKMINDLIDVLAQSGVVAEAMVFEK
jgi:ferredoxin-NADP reductase